tara:strand:- start:2566 stop:4458 length:1893 start_codon:yes stop_codon:yes gene_type:complete
MCGFAGFLNFNNSYEMNNHSIRRMIEIQKHRGPDDSGIVGINTFDKSFETITVDKFANFNSPKNLLFGFNRLSILDLSSNGHQPMFSPDKKVVLMMNGEVYNAFDFKKELLQKGHIFKSTSDTEIVLKLYLEYGMESMISKLNGMFALAIYDFNLDTLFLARDRYGIKPLYVLQEKNRLAFSSEIKSFKKLTDFNLEPDFSRIDEFLLFRNLINNTLFKNITNCIPGTYFSIKKNKVESHLYYDINDEGNSTISTLDSFSKLENTLKKSVERQMISDVKLGCQLSGGVDSSLVTYYASKKLDKGNLETISIIFKDKKFSEEKFVDEVSKKLLLKSHKFEMEAEYYFDVIENAIWHFEHPLNHPNTIGIYLLSQSAKKHVTVLLSGEGADESLAGYNRFLITNKNKVFTKSFFAGLKRNWNYIFDFLSYSLNTDKNMVMATSFSNISTAKSLKSSFNLKNAITNRVNILKKLKGSKNTRQRKYELITFLPDLLMRQDKMSMAHSIENRVPFLDNEMVSTSLNISDDALIALNGKKLECKKVLKDIAAQKFGESFAYRNKMGFAIPLRSFMASNIFKKKWKDIIEPGLKKRGLFKTNSLSKWVNNIEKATPQQLDAIWLMLGFEIWAKQYLD